MAPAAESVAAENIAHCQPELSVPRPAANVTPASRATRLATLLMPDARPSSDVFTLDITEAVSGVTSMANEIPSKACGVSRGAARLHRFHAGRAGEVCAGAPAQVLQVIQSNRTGLSATRHTAALARL
jgi:hypothetical protein